MKSHLPEKDNALRTEKHVPHFPNWDVMGAGTSLNENIFKKNWADLSAQELANTAEKKTLKSERSDCAH